MPIPDSLFYPIHNLQTPPLETESIKTGSQSKPCYSMIDQNTFEVIFPEKTAGAIKILMERHSLSGDDALCMFMSSKTYRGLHDPSTGFYALETMQLVDMFDAEKMPLPETRTTTGYEAMRFKVYCVVEYSRIRKIESAETIKLFLKYGVLWYLDFDIMQWQDLESTVDDIDEFISNRKKPATANG